MCGICGVVDSSRSDNKDYVSKMCSGLYHRGPDDGGVFLSGPDSTNVCLGHRRLSIIDLSSQGRQPMSDASGRLQLVFNGEIYNYNDLKKSLQEKGYGFNSNTDTENLLYLYKEYGQDCLSFLRGMFSFALWDKEKQMLFAARDRVGKKPFYYYFKGGKFVFASELSALVSSGLINKEISTAAIHYYLTFGYIPSPLTIYKDVFKLPPAHCLVLKDNTLSIRKYWQLDYRKKTRLDEKEASIELLRLLKEATGIRLYSDVPLGAFLSGGIDSSAIVALMCKLSGKKIDTFSIGFGEQDYNELHFARKIADRFGTNHHEFIVRPNALEILPLLIERYGEPYADSSCIPTYYLSKETKRFVTVALNGDGGDECFAGYERYQAMLLANSLRKMPGFVLSAVLGLSRALPDNIEQKNAFRRIRRFVDGAKLPDIKRYLRWVGVFDQTMLKDLYADGMLERVSNVDPAAALKPFFDCSVGGSYLDKLLATDVHTYLPDDLLVKADIASMSNSLELRSPFLDHIFMQFAAGLPQDYKLRRGVKKYILKKAFEGLLPKENIYRRKMGFGIPVGRWFRKELRAFLSESLLSDKSLNRGYFKPQTVKLLVKEHIQGRKDFSFQLWALLMFELWHEKFID